MNTNENAQSLKDDTLYLYILDGISQRINNSYLKGYLTYDQYTRGVGKHRSLRASVKKNLTEPIVLEIKEFASEFGSLNVSHQLILHGVQDTNVLKNIDFYDSVYSPVSCLTKDFSRLLDTNYDISEEVMETQEEDGFSLASSHITQLLNTPSYRITGASLVFFVKGVLYCFFGYYKNETLDPYLTDFKDLNGKFKRIKEQLKYKVDKVFVDEFLRCLSIRDFDSMADEELASYIVYSYAYLKKIASYDTNQLMTEFKDKDGRKRRDMMMLLLMRDIGETFLQKLKDDTGFSEVFPVLFQSMHLKLQKKLVEILKKGGDSNPKPSGFVLGKRRRRKRSVGDMTLREQLDLFPASKKIKRKAYEKLSMMENSQTGDAKSEKFVRAFLELPFDKYKKEDIIVKGERILKKSGEVFKKIGCKNVPDTIRGALHEVNTNFENMQSKNSTKRNRSKVVKGRHSIKKLKGEFDEYVDDTRAYIKNVRNVLDSAVYGHDHAKTQIERYVAQWMNGKHDGVVLGIEGPPGNGKTSLIQNGLCKCLLDDKGKPRPFVKIPLGGLKDGSAMSGHGFTYVGSTWGKIADGLMKSECMNPIFFLDELDKVSKTAHGQEIIGILTHLTDKTQNKEFYDEYFDGIPLDLSKAMFIFTFNDRYEIDSILRDRIQIINTKPLKIHEKITIAQDYMLPEIKKNMGMTAQDLTVSDENLRYIIESYTVEAGVRKFKELLNDFAMELNRRHVMGDLEFPVKLDKERIVDILRLARKHPIEKEKVDTQGKEGVMNGLYASTSGLGGITKIQAFKMYNKEAMCLKLTGSLGDVMKESVECARTVAWNLLTDAQKKTVRKEKYGIHVHFPCGSVKKEGPSAGSSTSLSLYSLFTGKAIRPDIAMTGECDLGGRITKIGGLSAKLNGAKKAGVRFCLVPEENAKDIEDIKIDYPDLFDESFQYKLVNHINQVIESDVFVSDK